MESQGEGTQPCRLPPQTRIWDFHQLGPSSSSSHCEDWFEDDRSPLSKYEPLPLLQAEGSRRRIFDSWSSGDPHTILLLFQPKRNQPPPASPSLSHTITTA